MSKGLLTKGFFRKNEKESVRNGICILGSGRCGTSMMTRAVSFLGVYIGSSFIKTNRANPKGFWENKQIYEIQKEINAYMQWRRPYPAGWQDRMDVRHFKNELKDLVVKEFSHKKFWAWKDPRSCECIALWKDILKELDISPHYIIMVRNPVDVASSFKRAYDDHIKKSLQLWQLRILISLAETEGESRIIMDYDDFLDNSLIRLNEISETFQLPWPQDESRIKNKLSEFVDPDMRHRQTPVEELGNMEYLDPEMIELYQLCLKGVHSREFLHSETFTSEVERLYELFLEKDIKV